MSEKVSKDAITQRVVEYLSSHNMSETKFAKELGLGQSTLNKQIRVCGVTTETICLMLERYPDVSAEWLMRGIEPDTKNDISRTHADHILNNTNIEIAKLQAQLDLLYKVIDKLAK